MAERAKAQKLATEEAERKSAEQAAAKLAKGQEAEKLKLGKAERKSHTANLLDDLSKTSNPSASLSQISEDIEEGEQLEELEAEPIFSPIKGGIKSKRGCERMQKIINEKRDLETQIEDLQVGS